MPFLIQVKWKGGPSNFSTPSFPPLSTSMFFIPVIYFLLKKIRFCSDSCNRSFPIPPQKVSVFRFRDNGNCYFRFRFQFRLKTCSGSFTNDEVTRNHQPNPWKHEDETSLRGCVFWDCQQSLFIMFCETCAWLAEKPSSSLGQVTSFR